MIIAFKKVAVLETGSRGTAKVSLIPEVKEWIQEGKILRYQWCINDRKSLDDFKVYFKFKSSNDELVFKLRFG